MIRRGIIVFSVLFFIFLGCYVCWRTHNGSTDFDTYYYAAKRITAHIPLYQETAGLSPYLYPPIFACLIIPFTVFSLESASLIWYVLNLAFFFLSFLACRIIIFGNKDMKNIYRPSPPVFKILFFIITLILFLDNISVLQTNIMVFSAGLAGLYFFRRHMDIFAGLFLALAISIKPIPIPFLFYFLIKREFRVAVFIVLWAVMFSIAIPALNMGPSDAINTLALWNKGMLASTASADPGREMIDIMFSPSNQSVAAFFSRWFIANDYTILGWKRLDHGYHPLLINMTFSLSRDFVFYLYKGVISLLVLAAFLRCSRKIKDRRESILSYEYALIFVTALIMNPVLRVQQFIFLVFPMLLVLSHIGLRRQRLFYIGFGCLAALYISQAAGIFKIFGFGTLSIFLLWALVFAAHRSLLQRPVA